MALHNIVDEVVPGEVGAHNFVLQLVDSAINEDLKGENNSGKPTDPAEHSSCAIQETQSVVLVVKDEDLDEVAQRDIHIIY
ncbi:hypothetical protein A2U01_0003912 [Trifolium medium]|uniref:Uncharacterized protein n=1 Tax=Trifolium medium TaxID=97028 RepID=A0A392M6M8_9FABA|nr:hypothetical protein [Trifolium medium]